MKVIIAGGGTGGHIFPALAIAEELMHRDIENNILFVGTLKGMEKKLISDRGYNLMYIRSAPIMGKGIYSKIRGALVSLLGIIDSFNIIKDFKPDVVVGVGGYVSGPVLISSFLSGVHRVICEQNSIPGITNRVLSYFAEKIFISFENSRRYFPAKKTVLSGNPIQKKIARVSHEMAEGNNRICVLILGGSQGASKLNEILPITLKELTDLNIKVIHQTGKKDYENVLKNYQRLNVKADVCEFVYDIEKLYSQADIVISRSGAGTLAEICAVGLPSILVPYPYATHDHQYHNAKALEDLGASIIIKDKDLNANILGETIRKVVGKDILEDMSYKAKNAGKPNASEIVVDNIFKLVDKKNV